MDTTVDFLKRNCGVIPVTLVTDDFVFSDLDVLIVDGISEL